MKLLPTPLLNFYIENLDNIVNNQYNYPNKMVMLSGHDIDIAQMMTSLNISSWQCIYDQWFKGSTDALNCYWRPYYASSLILELFLDDLDQKTYYVMIKYNGKYVKLCE
jgi:hypothetical protein